MTPSNSPHKSSSLANILDIARFSSLDSVETAVYEIQGFIRKDNIHLIIEDLLEERNTNLLPFVLSCLDAQQQSWILDLFPTNPKEYSNSFSERLLAKLSRFFLVAPTFLSNELSLPPSQEQEIEAVQAILDELAYLEFPDDAPVDTKHSQRQMKKQRRAAAKSKAINPAAFRLLDMPIPTNTLEIYVDHVCSDEFGEAMKEACVLLPQDVVEVPARDPASATADEAVQLSVESQVQGSVYPKVQPMRSTSTSALYFDSPEGFGDWIIVIHEGAEKELRFRHKKDQKTFDIIVKKIKELSHGHFSPDNCKRLNRNGSDAVVFEAKMTGDLRLVYQIDLVPHHDERVRQALKIFGIFTHAKMDERLWDGLASTLAGRSKEYRQRCAVRQRTPNADDHTFSPTFFPPLPEASEYTEMGSMLVDEANLAPSFKVFNGEPLMNTMLADLDATFPHAVSSREKAIIEHPHSCYVVGRSGTGKTTTLLFKMLLVERTYQLAEPGTPKPRQVFVTQSRILAKKVKEYFKTLARALHVSTQSPDQLSELQDIAAEEEEEDNIALDDIKDWYKDLPSKFSQLEDRHFPLFVTYSTLCSMLEADMIEKSPERSALVNGGADAVARIGSISHGSAAVDFDCFVKKYWPSLPEPLTKRIDPSLAFSELIGVIKGSEETLMENTRAAPALSTECI
ncbi:hypothetical protein AAF712_011675 [Marasmius tenuissimus]|uniref:Uncharacterized protein n=1 Tax=Marasmius tenuissimus TaxID=585030 RepID=A0ABR2ZIQ4_9AGAR